jgi:hypothetical protein
MWRKREEGGLDFFMIEEDVGFYGGDGTSSRTIKSYHR